MITDGSAILGLGNIGARAGLPVIEGKAALLASLVGLSGIPILVESSSIDHFVDVVRSIAPSFGAILLEDIAAPRCFEIEHKLRARLDMPVLHDDQHATAVVTLAALLNATRITGASLEKLVVGIIGLGAAGLGIARLLRAFGVQRLIGTDLRPEATGRLAELHGQGVTLHGDAAPRGRRHRHHGCEGPHSAGFGPPRADRAGAVESRIRRSSRTSRAKRAPKWRRTARASTTCSRFPGLFAGALRARATSFTDAMLLAASRTIAQAAPEGQLVPDALNGTIHEAVAAAVAAAVKPPH